MGQFCYPLCFDNDPFCLSRNPFLLITIWIAYVWNRSSRLSLPSLFATLCKKRNASPYFSTACALFVKNAGVVLVSLTKSSSGLASLSAKPCEMNTQHPTKDADPERPPGAEGFLPYSGQTLTTVKSILTESGHRNSFKMNTYEKTGGEGPHRPTILPVTLVYPECSACPPTPGPPGSPAPKLQTVNGKRPTTNRKRPTLTPLAAISVPDFAMTENCRLRTDDSSPLAYPERLLREAAGRFLPSSATIRVSFYKIFHQQEPTWQ